MRVEWFPLSCRNFIAKCFGWISLRRWQRLTWVDTRCMQLHFHRACLIHMFFKFHLFVCSQRTHFVYCHCLVVVCACFFVIMLKNDMFISLLFAQCVCLTSNLRYCLTLYQITNFRLFPTDRGCRRQFQICKLQKIL